MDDNGYASSKDDHGSGSVKVQTGSTTAEAGREVSASVPAASPFLERQTPISVQTDELTVLKNATDGTQQSGIADDEGQADLTDIGGKTLSDLIESHALGEADKMGTVSSTPKNSHTQTSPLATKGIRSAEGSAGNPPTVVLPSPASEPIDIQSSQIQAAEREAPALPQGTLVQEKSSRNFVNEEKQHSSQNAHIAMGKTPFELNLSGPVRIPVCPAGMKIYSQAQDEFSRVRKAHRTLAPTGCTADFCQAGRATRINEPRVGRDRPLAEVHQEAIDFLKECRDYDVIQDDDALDLRIREALVEISNSAVFTRVTDRDGNQSYGIAGGVWRQTHEELEYGLRASWRNSKRCIMRSEHQHLALCDLRDIETSYEMGQIIVQAALEAFNGGRIVPTTFVFPPRQPGKRGPMFWNGQLLSFAGYRLHDGSILGDPMNVELTEAIMELGWKPPVEKSRWDVLPIVTMAENDGPCVTELPEELKRTVPITHPRYIEEFKRLDLHWVMAPALSRLGFDIGGVQYTASPFIGWFMDAEIGVRNLGDSFRYNALPSVVERLQLSNEPDTLLDDLPEYMRMAALSRAQVELNFAVYYSFQQERITMVDTLTASTEYENYDDARKDEVGYRLPADPYWLAPPQGSIVPLWHRGAAPNYQPKPMICRHVQDPIKAWRRECSYRIKSHSEGGLLKQLLVKTKDVRPKIAIFFCSSGVSAGKMARKLYDIMHRLVQQVEEPFRKKDAYVVEKAKPLNALDVAEFSSQDLILIIASTTGRGEVPANALKFVKRCESMLTEPLSYSPRFSCLANGDSTYGDTYNAAAKVIQNLMTRVGYRSLLDGYHAGDTSVNNPDWDSFNNWVAMIDRLIFGDRNRSDTPPPSALDNVKLPPPIIADMPSATLVRCEKHHPNGMYFVTLNIGDREYQEMDHVKILTPNTDAEVQRALSLLFLNEDDLFEWHHENAFDYLSKYVDLDHCFRDLDWYPGYTTLSEARKDVLRSSKVFTVLEGLRDKNFYTNTNIEKICKDMTSIQPRLYSAASSPEYVEHGVHEGLGNFVDIIVKHVPGGRFSDAFLLQAELGATLRFAITSADPWKIICAQNPNSPFIAITTGSGIGPVRAVLQRRITEMGRISRRSSIMQRRSNRSSIANLSPFQMASSPRLSVSGDVFNSINHSRRVSWANFSSNFPISAIDHLDLAGRRGSLRGLGIGAQTFANSLPTMSGFRDPNFTPPSSYGFEAASTARGSLNLLAGFKNEDTELIQSVIQPASQAELFDILELVPSNSARIRVQDHILLPDVRDKLAKKLKDPGCIVFVCANSAVAEAAIVNLSIIAKANVRDLLGERYIEEIFHV